jgi:hypothetical protein
VSFLPCYANLFGARGLNAATVPILLIASTQDATCNYNQQAVFAYQHLGSPEHYLLGLVNAGHMQLNAIQVRALIHFTTAYFVHHLQGDSTAGDYFTPEFVSRFPDLSWGA